MNKILIASDFHLGIPNHEASKAREKKLINWLCKYEDEIDTLILLGDIFDFWFEYKKAIPKGHVRFIGKLAELADKGIQIILFRGNHDMWMFDYFKTELNAQIVSNEMEFIIAGKRFWLHHGDGLGKGDYGYKFIKTVFRSSICQWLFARLHPNFGIGLAQFLSNNSRLAKGQILEHQGEEAELIEQHILKLDQENKADYYLCGHRHLPGTKTLPSGATYINTGDWFMHCSYAIFDGEKLELRYFEENLLA